MIRLQVLGCAFITFVAGNSAWPESAGDKTLELRFKDIRYAARSLSDFGERQAYVIMFVQTRCPHAGQSIPILSALHEAYAPKGVQVLAINAGSDSIRDMAAQALAAEAPYPFVKDTDGTCVKALGANRTPETFVLDGARTVRYRGAPDGDRIGRALDALLAGQPIPAEPTEAAGCVIELADSAESVGAPPTYAKDVAPILNRHCVECHRPNTAAPFSLLHFAQAAPRADAIAEVVSEGRMPPWFAHGDGETFVNKRVLSEEEKRTILAWVHAGAPEGDPAQAPAPPAFPESSWTIGEPDLVLTAERPVTIPATGYLPYQYVTFPYQFPHDTWVQGIEIMPSNPRVLHHCNMIYLLPGQKYDQRTNFLTGRVPGGSPANLKDGLGMLIPKGAQITLQIHYVTTGKEEQDRISAGFRYAKEPIRRRVRYKIIHNDTFAIPPGAAAYRVTAEGTLNDDVSLLAMFTHMHLRGKDMTFLAHRPDGVTQTLLTIPNYSFDWQLTYYLPEDALKLPKGTRLECIGHFDNSPFNPFNPDPSATVKDGPQTFEEMMYGFFFYTVDAERLRVTVDPATGAEMPASVARR